MGTEIATKTNPEVMKMRAIFEQYKPDIQGLLPKYLDAERVFKVALMAFGRVPKLAECTAASVLGGAIESSRLGLEFGAGAGETWAVPFKNGKTGQMECQLIVDYRGLVKLMKNGSGVGAVMAEDVYENDAFDMGIKDGKYLLNWSPAKGARGKRIGCLAATWDKEGNITAHCYKTDEEIERDHRSRSKAKDFGPWKNDELAMRKKSLIRVVAKLNPYSTADVQRAVALDERHELGKPQDLALLADPTAMATPEDEPQPTYEMPKEKAPEPQEPASDAQEPTEQESEPLGDNETIFTPVAYAIKAGEKGGKKWNKHSARHPDGEWYTTFSDTIGATLKNAAELKQAIRVKFEIKGEYKNIVSAVLA